MIDFHLVDENGMVIMSGSCADSDFQYQSRNGIPPKLGAALPGKQYYDGDVLKTIPAAPTDTHVFNASTKQWEDPRTLADLKAAKNAAINAARLKANQSHFVFMGKQIAVDPLSRSDIDATHGAILMLGAMPGGWPGGWKAMDNTIVPIADLATWGQFYGAMVAQGTANFAHAQALKAQLAAATNAEEVAAVPDW